MQREESMQREDYQKYNTELEDKLNRMQDCNPYKKQAIDYMEQSKQYDNDIHSMLMDTLYSLLMYADKGIAWEEGYKAAWDKWLKEIR